MKKICVIIPQYGFSDITKKCIFKTFLNAGVPVEILVVDDGSPEPFDKGLLCGDIHVLRLKENSGFTNAVNQGILWCGDRYDYIHLLNNDTEPEPDFIKVLLDVMEANPVIGIASSSRTIERHDDCGGGRFIENWGIDLVSGYQMCTEVDIPDEIVYVEWVPLCSALLRMEMIRYIGLLDRRMKTHCSDNLYCIHANENGWNVALVPKSKVFHHQEMTTREHKRDPRADQAILINKISGGIYTELLKKLPLDFGTKTFGKIQFLTYQKTNGKEG